MSLTQRQKHLLKKFVKELSQYRGRHTELVTVYIPAGYDMNKIINHLYQEQDTASNIKSTGTRKNVIAALEKMIQHLKVIGITPDNGLAAFAGNVAEREGQQDIRVWSIEPPTPLKTRIYRCDKEFVLELLIDLMEIKEVYGLVVMDRREADIAYLKGKTIIPLESKKSNVPGKSKAGGQCLDKETLVMINEKCTAPIGEFQVGNRLKTYDFKKNELKNASCLDYWKKNVNKLLIIKTKKNKIKASRNHLFFVDKENKIKEIPAKNLKIGDNLLIINKEYKKEKISIISIEEKNGNFELIDISVKNKNFIADGLIVHNSAHRFERLREDAAKEFYKKCAEAVKKEFFGNKNLKGILVGGPGPTKHDFINQITTEIRNKIIAVKDLSYTGEFGLQELVDKSQDVLSAEDIVTEKKIMLKFFELLAKKPNKVSYGLDEVKKLLEMGVVDTLLLSEELSDEEIDELENLAKRFKTNVTIISTETREGAQLKDLGKVAAILRYEVHH